MAEVSSFYSYSKAVGRTAMMEVSCPWELLAVTYVVTWLFPSSINCFFFTAPDFQGGEWIL
jgi:hypothetical protein